MCPQICLLLCKNQDIFSQNRKKCLWKLPLSVEIIVPSSPFAIDLSLLFWGVKLAHQDPKIRKSSKIFEKNVKCIDIYFGSFIGSPFATTTTKSLSQKNGDFCGLNACRPSVRQLYKTQVLHSMSWNESNPKCHRYTIKWFWNTKV